MEKETQIFLCLFILIKMEILYEDNHIIIVNKSPREIVQGDKTGDKPLVDMVKDYLKEKYHKPGNVFCGVVHRLDRPTSGIVVFAKTSKALARLNEMFKKGEVDKTYWAIVKDLPPQDEGTLVHFLIKNQKNNKSVAYDTEKLRSKKAVLHYKLVGRSQRYYLLEVKLETGRHHQIRCQLAKIGLPIRGDLKYGAQRSNPDGSISLHARNISFVHPVSKKMIDITAPVPDDPLWKAFEI
jgi:23S rRNA pseudouridine1911/1915/1917 synthase